MWTVDSKHNSQGGFPPTQEGIFPNMQFSYFVAINQTSMFIPQNSFLDEIKQGFRRAPSVQFDSWLVTRLHSTCHVLLKCNHVPLTYTEASSARQPTTAPNTLPQKTIQLRCLYTALLTSCTNKESHVRKGRVT